jgi:S1-C subfamily serine protease
MRTAARVLSVASFMFLGLQQATVCTSQSVREVVRSAMPAVTLIKADVGDGVTIGTGFFIGGNTGQLLVTNYHVIQGASSAVAQLPDGRRFDLTKVVAMDRSADYAVVGVRGVAGSNDIPTVRPGDLRQADLGDRVVVIGNPLGLEFTVTDGIISQRRRLQRDGPEMIQISAAISQGNSGGPVLNLDGQVLGVATLTVEGGQNLNFAVPISLVMDAIVAASESNEAGIALPDVARWEAEQSQRERLAAIEQAFFQYRDPDGLFGMYIPRSWPVKRDVATDSTGERTVTTLMAPPTAALAEVSGYLSEGIRIELTLPAPGSTFETSDLERWSRDRMDWLLKANPGFVVTDSQHITFAAEDAMRYDMVGQNSKIAEPEQDVFIWQIAPHHTLKIELVAPARSFSNYAEAFGALVSTISLSPSLLAR